MPYVLTGEYSQEISFSVAFRAVQPLIVAMRVVDHGPVVGAFECVKGKGSAPPMHRTMLNVDLPSQAQDKPLVQA